MTEDELFGIKTVQIKTMPEKKHPTRTKELINDLARYRKDILIQLLGGYCQNCGQIFSQCAMDFHHKDGKEKGELAIGTRLRHYSEKAFWEKLLPNVVEKCMLLCSNCHRVLHWGKK